jgi:hypothetical protein
MLMAPDVSAQAPASDASVAAATPSSVATKPAAAGPGVQYVGDVKLDAKQTDRPCEEQTWPYIAPHCLKRASGPTPTTAKIAVDRADIKTSRAAKPASAPQPRAACSTRNVTPFGTATVDDPPHAARTRTERTAASFRIPRSYAETPTRVRCQASLSVRQATTAAASAMTIATADVR